MIAGCWWIGASGVGLESGAEMKLSGWEEARVLPS